LWLGCPGEEDPHRHVGAVAASLSALLEPGPELLIVQGDTSSALGAALSAFTSGVPVAHVEAGLRTYDPLLPWPEEIYRTAIDARAELLFAPTEIAAGNLAAEAVPGEIYLTGNTGIDALLAIEPRLAPRRTLRAGPRALVTCHRRESWGDGLQAIATALRELADDGMKIDFILHPNEHVARRMRELLGQAPGIDLLDPCSHIELLQRMRDSDIILSDSGGMQEEAPALGIPLLVLRDKTERPEGIMAGSARLVGTDARRIVDEVRRLLNERRALERMALRTFPYGDGHAAPRIAAIIEHWLEASKPASPKSPAAPRRAGYSHQP
jgi:UDP-N-acetylglucosamine 2-epimerase (non-hydrolysing)